MCGVKGTDQLARQNVLIFSGSSFLSLESAINRLHYDVFVRQDGMQRATKPSMPQPMIDFIRQATSRLSIRDKYLLLPPIQPALRFVHRSGRSLFEEFSRFRNRLVHPKVVAHSFRILVSEVSEESSLSCGGTVLEQRTAAPHSGSVFPLTGFATSFNSLEAADAEKAFEIAIRMRLALHVGVYASPSALYYDVDGRISVEMGSGIGSLISLRFGSLEDDFPTDESKIGVGA